MKSCRLILKSIFISLLCLSLVTCSDDEKADREKKLQLVVKSVTVNSIIQMMLPHQIPDTDYMNVFFVHYKSGEPWENFTDPFNLEIASVTPENPLVFDLSMMKSRVLADVLPEEGGLLHFGVGHAPTATPKSGDKHFFVEFGNLKEFIESEDEETSLIFDGLGVYYEIIIEKQYN